MATRMLFAMAAEQDSYERFLRQMDPAFRRSLAPDHLMDFIQSETGIALLLITALRSAITIVDAQLKLLHS